MTNLMTTLTLPTQDDDGTELDGHAIADGRWGVNLYMQFNAKTPEDAVEMFLNQVLTFGLRKFCYTVRDRREDDLVLVYVEDGVAYSDEDYTAKLAAEQADDDD